MNIPTHECENCGALWTKHGDGTWTPFGPDLCYSCDKNTSGGRHPGYGLMRVVSPTERLISVEELKHALTSQE